jgi:hypothetical protein
MRLRQRAQRAVTKVKTLAQLPARLRQARADHDLRHRPSGFHFVLAERIDQLRGDAWDAVTARASVCMGRPFLRLLERCGPSRLKMHYALVYRGSDPVAAVACQSLAVDASSLRRGRALGERGLARVKQRVLVCAARTCSSARPIS